MSRKFNIGDFVIFTPLNLKGVIKEVKKRQVMATYVYSVLTKDDINHYALENEITLDIEKMREEKIKSIIE